MAWRRSRCCAACSTPGSSTSPRSGSRPCSWTGSILRRLLDPHRRRARLRPRELPRKPIVKLLALPVIVITLGIRSSSSTSSCSTSRPGSCPVRDHVVHGGDLGDGHRDGGQLGHDGCLRPRREAATLKREGPPAPLVRRERTRPAVARTRDPYGVLVSEVMLQQTQVVRVVPRWTEWLGAGRPWSRSRRRLAPTSSVRGRGSATTGAPSTSTERRGDRRTRLAGRPDRAARRRPVHRGRGRQPRVRPARCCPWT